MLLKSYFLGSSMQFHADDQYGKFLDRFRNYLATRERGKGGGVTMFVKNNISFKRREGLEKSLSECIWIEIYVKHSKSFLVGCFYRPPETSKYLPKSYNRLLQNLLETIVKDNKRHGRRSAHLKINSKKCPSHGLVLSSKLVPRISGIQTYICFVVHLRLPRMKLVVTLSLTQQNQTSYKKFHSW